MAVTEDQIRDALDEMAIEKIVEQRTKIAELQEALQGLVSVIEAAGLSNLSNGVELGPTVWYVKASDAMAFAKETLK